MEKLRLYDKVTHKLTGQKMTIIRLSECVATCVKEIPEPYKFYGIEYPGDKAICHIENLEKIQTNGQTVLF